MEADKLLDVLAGKRGCIQAGGVIDRQKISEILIQDFRDGRIGNITLESPELWQKWMSEFVAEAEEQIENEEEQGAEWNLNYQLEFFEYRGPNLVIAN